MTRHAAEWGLAALLGGGFLFVAGPVTLLLAAVLADNGRRIMNRTDIALARVGGTVLMLVILGLVGLCLFAAAKALLSLRSHGQPRGLALVGLALGVVNGLLWLFTAGTLLMTLYQL
jgi:hypothetical protein